jgi:hypothetical protein
VKKIVTVVGVAVGVLSLASCGDWMSSPYPSGEVIEVAEKDEWVEYDCTIDGAGDIEPESCDAEYVEDCYMVRFVTDDGVEFTDCTDKSAWKAIDVGDDYVDE